MWIRRILSLATVLVLTIAGLAIATARNPRIGVSVLQLQPKQPDVEAGPVATFDEPGIR